MAGILGGGEVESYLEEDLNRSVAPSDGQCLRSQTADEESRLRKTRGWK